MPKILVVGEIMSQKDMESGEAFSDGNGRFLKAIMNKVGLSPRQCKFINVFPITAPRGSIMSLTGPKAQGIPLVKPIRRGKYIRAEFALHLHNLWAIVKAERPNLILALGDGPLWALTSHNNIDYARGYITPGNSEIHGAKVLPTYSPKQVQQNYPLLPIFTADLTKALRESQWPEIRYPQQEIWIEPTIADLTLFEKKYIHPSPELSVDIENKPGMITCIGFAPDESHALVIPFYDSRKSDGNYWPTLAEELQAWAFVQHLLESGKRVFGQNYAYDMQVLYRLNGIRNPNFTDDTMLLHHAMQPEMKKSLGFLTSIYGNTVAWKAMRTDTLKQEDE